jgi:CheY-like chemotaxis protein
VSKLLLIVDDDELSREVLSIMGAAAGYEVIAAESGDAALVMLKDGTQPEVILTDLQMPGTTGAALLEAVRAASKPPMRVVAMSASGNGIAGFDAFLRKPFSLDELKSALAGGASNVEGEETGRIVLDEAVYASFERMGTVKRRELYAMCLDDAERRIQRMRRTIQQGDVAAFAREAHGLKGGCGLVGATELHGLAAAMEDEGIARKDAGAGREGHLRDFSSSLEGLLDQFVVASGRLRRILNAQE